MRTLGNAGASPTDGRQPWVASCHRRWLRLSPLAREIILILAVKVLVLTAIWWAFFRHPAAPGMAMEPQRVESRVIGPVTTGPAPHARP